jgi:hypothetical protein
MGQQQLLLIVLGVIIVGIAIVIGISLFRAKAVDSNREALISDLYHLEYMANEYYKRPIPFGGGGNSFAGFTLPLTNTSNGNGTYTISVAGTATDITFQGVGTETGDDGTNPVKLQLSVTRTSNVITKLN